MFKVHQGVLHPPLGFAGRPPAEERLDVPRLLRQDPVAVRLGLRALSELQQRRRAVVQIDPYHRPLPALHRPGVVLHGLLVAPLLEEPVPDELLQLGSRRGVALGGLRRRPAAAPLCVGRGGLLLPPTARPRAPRARRGRAAPPPGLRPQPLGIVQLLGLPDPLRTAVELAEAEVHALEDVRGFVVLKPRDEGVAEDLVRAPAGGQDRGRARVKRQPLGLRLVVHVHVHPHEVRGRAHRAHRDRLHELQLGRHPQHLLAQARFGSRRPFPAVMEAAELRRLIQGAIAELDGVAQEHPLQAAADELGAALAALPGEGYVCGPGADAEQTREEAAHEALCAQQAPEGSVGVRGRAGQGSEEDGDPGRGEADLHAKCAEKEESLRLLQKRLGLSSKWLYQLREDCGRLKLDTKKLGRKHERAKAENSLSREVLQLQETVEQHRQQRKAEQNEIAEALAAAQRESAEKTERLREQWEEQKAKYAQETAELRDQMAELQAAFEEARLANEAEVRERLDSVARQMSDHRTQCEEQVAKMREDSEAQILELKAQLERDRQQVREEKERAMADMEERLEAAREDLRQQEKAEDARVQEVL